MPERSPPAMPPDRKDQRPARRRRRRRPTEPPVQNVAAVLKEARPALAPIEADIPLSAEEAARMKEHLAFLRTHRRVFKLKVNAAEDLLLNGKREPTHRGICLHLLAKVERARVLSASEQLPPKAATELLAGVIRFAPELPYILRFLECVRASETTGRASAALSQALRGLDFDALSKAQTRQVLALILETFPQAEWPGFVLELLDKPAFRQAFDRSSDEWPVHLTELLVPLRAVHRVLWRNPARHGSDPKQSTARAGAPEAEFQAFAPPETAALLQGVTALLAVPSTNLTSSLSEPRRQRLLQLGTEALRVGPGAPAALLALFESCHFASAERRSTAAASLGSALLAGGHERAARQVLQAERERLPPAVAAWVKLLDQPRLGPLAVLPHPRQPGSAPDARATREQPASLPAHRWLPAWHVPSQQGALLRVGEPGEQPLFEAHAELWRAAWLPQVAALLASTTHAETKADRPFLAVQQPGRNFLGRSRQRAGRVQWLAWSLELCALLQSLARAGVALPDAKLSRFSVDAGERLWLVDLWGASRAAADVVAKQHAELALGQIEELAQSADTPLFSGALLEGLRQAGGLGPSMQLLLEAQ